MLDPSSSLGEVAVTLRLHPTWHAEPPSSTPLGQRAVWSEQVPHMPYMNPFTLRVQPLDLSCFVHASLQVDASAPRARIMHACAHERSSLLPSL